MSTTEVDVLPVRLEELDFVTPLAEPRKNGGERRRGVFITFEGIDGSGKTTQLKMLAKKLRTHGHDVIETAEPGGTAIGVQIRSILLDSKNRELCSATELLLMFAARAQNVEESILPALDMGRIVLSDRFTDSTVVYQGVGRGLGIEPVMTISRIACQGLTPDLTICMNIDVNTGLARALTRDMDKGVTETRMEEQALEFHQKVHAGYLELAKREPERVRLVDGVGEPEEIAGRVWDIVSRVVTSR